MRSLVTFAALTLVLVGCSGGADNDLYDLATAPYEGGGGGSNNAVPPASDAGPDTSACSAVGQASVTGAFSGSAFVAKDAIELFEAATAQFIIEITDYAKACSFAPNVHASSSAITIVYGGGPLDATTFDVTKTAGLSAKLVQYDAACAPSKVVAATSGTITFDKVGVCGANGTFDLMFGADHVTTTFTATACSTASGAPSCK